MGTSLERIAERTDGVTVTFDDGTTEESDLVVGADGVHSTVRNQCINDWICREFDTYAWSLWAQQDVDVGQDMVSVWGPGSEGFVTRVGDPTHTQKQLINGLDHSPSHGISLSEHDDR